MSTTPEERAAISRRAAFDGQWPEGVAKLDGAILRLLAERDALEARAAVAEAESDIGHIALCEILDVTRDERSRERARMALEAMRAGAPEREVLAARQVAAEAEVAQLRKFARWCVSKRFDSRDLATRAEAALAKGGER